MYTFCPSCHAVFRLTTSHLAKASGRTRCSECRRIFSAVDYLFEDLPATREAQQQSRRQQAEDLAAITAQDQAETAPENLLSESQAATAAEIPEPPLLDRSTADWSQNPLKLPSVFSGVAIILLVLLIGVQWVYFNRDELVKEARWRPGMEQFCKFLQCNLPLQVDLAQLELLNRDVRQHPRVKEALLVNATLSNNAEFTQPYPILEVSFTDLGGNPVAVRRFQPLEYINDRYTLKRGMLPGEPIPVVLEILDPGKVAASYQFGFL